MLGLFVQNKDFIPHYAEIAKPLSRLTGKVPWVFGEVERKSFNTLKKACCDRTSLANPDYSKQFHIDTDASDVGYGFTLYQVDEMQRELPVMYGSKCWANNKEACRPIYYREGHSLFYAVKSCRYYIESSSLVTIVHTDHSPLQWVLHSKRGQVTPWNLEEVADLTFKIEFKPGVENGTADAMSRYPIVPERPQTFGGVISCVSALLASLPASAKDIKSVWAWADDETKAVSRVIQSWRNPSPWYSCLRNRARSLMLGTWLS